MLDDRCWNIHAVNCDVGQDLVCLDGQGEDGVSESVCTTHSHELTALSLSTRGSMVATASTKVRPCTQTAGTFCNDWQTG